MTQKKRDRIVIKVGTSSLLGASGQPSKSFEYIAESIRVLRDNYDVVLVTSGAIGFGMKQLALASRPDELAALQGLSMIGQVGLMRRWVDAFSALQTGQVLVTTQNFHDDLASRNLIASLEQLWAYGVVPIVNENDAVSTEEITFGDNDQLAAHVAVLITAKRLVLLTDHDGIMKDFGTEQQARLAEVAIDEALRHVVASSSAVGKGGASSKLLAASYALDANVEVFIGHGASARSIESVLAGQSGTKIVQ